MAKCLIGLHQPVRRRAVRLGLDWVSHCQHCRQPMTFNEQTGWSIVRRATRWRPARVSRTGGLLACLAITLVPLQGSAAQKSFSAMLAGPKSPSLAEVEYRQMQASGLNCRSSFDGSNEDAVRLVKESAGNPASYAHVETQVWPAEDGRNAFAMTYTLEDRAGHRELHRAFGWIDNASCEARITG